MAGTSAERGREVRQRLIGAAAELVAECGWNGVSTRAVAERAGVGAGLVHYHFASLQALLSEAAVGVMRDVLGRAAPLLAEAHRAEGVVELMLASLDDYTGLDPTSLLFTETYLAATRDEQVRDAVRDLVATFRGQLADWLRRDGVADPEATAAVLAAAMDGVMLHRALDPGMTAEAVTPVVRRLLGRDTNKGRSI